VSLLPDRDTLAEYSPVLTRIAAAAGVIALGVAFIVVLFGSRATYEVDAVFEDVRGLIPGGEVKAGAEVVGSVEDIDLNDDGLPVVTMSIDDDFRLNQGAFANLRLASNVPTAPPWGRARPTSRSTSTRRYPTSTRAPATSSRRSWPG
jgi:hypothetical protein